MRTDSTRLSPLFINEAFKYIEDNFGEKYKGAVKVGKKNDNVQDAHEAIRPTSLYRTPEQMKKYLSNDEYKVYSIIYARALASLMADGEILSTTVILDNNDYKFKATGVQETFDGFLKVYRDYFNASEDLLPDMSKYNGKVSTKDVETEQKFTKPVSRYTEATLIEEMEKLGIGRPSTYATTMKILRDRAYVEVKEKKFYPTEVGIETTDKLQEFFSDIINVDYTAKMEEDLDEIADDHKDNIPVLREFYDKFEPLVKKAFDEMEKKAPTLTGNKCPQCGSDMVIRKSRYGEFEACSNYPKCKYIKQEEKEETPAREIIPCPKCDGHIVEKISRRGKVFYGCDNYPKCDQAYWDEPNGEYCPKCGSPLVVHGKKSPVTKCSECDYIK
jgi:DNA topoisomerase-1